MHILFLLQGFLVGLPAGTPAGVPAPDPGQDGAGMFVGIPSQEAALTHGLLFGHGSQFIAACFYRFPYQYALKSCLKNIYIKPSFYGLLSSCLRLLSPFFLSFFLLCHLCRVLRVSLEQVDHDCSSSARPYLTINSNIMHPPILIFPCCRKDFYWVDKCSQGQAIKLHEKCDNLECW